MNSYTFLVSAILMTSLMVSLKANPTQPTCANGEYQCQTSRECIPADWVCDGLEECEGGDDERQNCEARTCDEGFWQCATGECIPSSWQCDKDADCADRSDETGCRYVPETAAERRSHRHRNLGRGNRRN